MRLLHRVLHVVESLFEVFELFCESKFSIVCLFDSLISTLLSRLAFPLELLDKGFVFSDSHIKAE